MKIPAFFALLIAVFLLMPQGVTAQRKKKKKFTKAQKIFNRGEYNKAIIKFSNQAKNGKRVGYSNFMIGESYRKTNRIDKALPYYQKSIEAGYQKDAAKVYYAFALKANAEFDEAEKILNAYLDNPTDSVMAKLAKKEIQNLQMLETLRAKNSYYRVKNLEAINTPDDEYSPFYFNGNLYFTSNRGHGKQYKADGTNFSNLYYVKTKGAKVELSTLKKMSDAINDANVNDAILTMTKSGRYQVFAKGNSGKKSGTDDVHIYSRRFRRGKWTKPTYLGLNQKDSWDSCPSITPNGRTIYFASNRPGGYGGLDLYSARITGRGRWGGVKNLGPEINTAGNETFPYISNNGVFYFASDGHPGLGGLDLFEVKRKDGKKKIINMGSPINSAKDDFGLFLYSEDRGFFSSNRDGGVGRDDIFTFVNQDPDLKIVNYYLNVVTKYKDKNDSIQILSNVNVQLQEPDSKEEITTVVSNDSGLAQFKVYEGDNYSILGKREGYFNTRDSFSMIEKGLDRSKLVKKITNKVYTLELVLEKLEIEKTFVLENIFYDLDKSEIRDDAAIELDKLITILKDNPEINIELSSHTDSIASNEYNIKLSQRRAESAVNYIVSQGIDRSRLIARGYGETRPIARNTNPDGTDNPEGRQKNRRTEFKVISLTDAKALAKKEKQNQSRQKEIDDELDDAVGEDIEFDDLLDESDDGGNEK